MKKVALLKVLTCLLCGCVFGEDRVDLQVVHRIKAEAFRNSKVMDHLFYLTDANGPRLTGSPGWESAANWVVGEMKKYGIENGHLESWGPFGRGWSFSRFEMQMEKPAFAPLHGTPMAWCGGTEGVVRGPVIATSLLREDEDRRSLDIETIRERIVEYKQQWKGKLHGKIALLGQLRDFKQPAEAQSQRLDDKALTSQTEEPGLAPSPKQTGFPTGCQKMQENGDSCFDRFPWESWPIIGNAVIGSSIP